MKTSVRNAVEQTLDSIRRNTPAYAELADRFAPLLLSSAALGEELAQEGVEKPVVDPARLAAGVPVLAGVDLAPWKELFVRSAETQLPELYEVLGLEESVRKALRDHFSDPEEILGLARARIGGDWKYFENTSEKFDTVSAIAFLYISENVSAPVLCAMVRALGESLSSQGWDHGYCPVCGSSPSISLLSPKEVSDLDQLVGGGGKKFLHCSLCGHDWRYKRNACAACGNDENDTREILYADDRKFQRVEACNKCGKYLLNIDMRECDPLPDLDAIQLGLIHLDIHARKNKLQPVTRTLWNNLE
jgi:FdhE protein